MVEKAGGKYYKQKMTRHQTKFIFSEMSGLIMKRFTFLYKTFSCTEVKEDLTCHFEKVESYYSLHISALLDHADASLEEGVEGSTLEHAVLQQGEVDELMYDIVVLSIIGYDVVALLLFVAHGLLGVLQVVLLFLGNLLGLLLVL